MNVNFILIVIISLFLNISCKNIKYDDLERNHDLDSVSTTFMNFQINSPFRVKDTFDYSLIRFVSGDSLVSFVYFNDNKPHGLYAFYTKGRQFKLFYPNLFNYNDYSIPYLMLKDSISVSIRNITQELYKYEIVNPPVDGAGCYLFARNYGLIGIISYSWNTILLITNWNNIDFKKEVEFLLSNDLELFMSRKSI